MPKGFKLQRRKRTIVEGRRKKKSLIDASAFKEVLENRQQDMNATDSTNYCGSVAETFDVEGDDVDDDLLPALWKKLIWK